MANGGRLLYQFLLLLSMWLMAIMPLWSGMTFMLESVFLDHEGTFNYEIEENDVLTNVTTYYNLKSTSPVILDITSGNELITVPSADGLAQGFGFPNVSFGHVATKQYITTAQAAQLPLSENSICRAHTQTRAMLKVAKYGYLTAEIQCGDLPEKTYFIHAARLLPKDPFGNEKVLNRFTTSNILNHLQEPAKIGITNKKADNDQLDGFVVIDLEKYSTYASSDPACKHKNGAFGAKQTFCPVSCSKEEGVSFATWDDTIYQDIEYAHSLRSFHKVNMFLFGSVYSSDSCTAGRSIGIDPVRPVGLANRPRFHVGCEEIYAEHWVVLLVVIVLVVFMVTASLPYLVTLYQTTSTWLKTQILADIDFASGMCNKKIIFIPLVIVSLREMAVIHALCIATAINGPSIVTVLFSISHTLPVWGLTWILSILQPHLRGSKGISIGKYTIFLRLTASTITGIYSILYCIWLTTYSGNIRNLYLGGYPVVQSLLVLTKGSTTVDALRNIGMYQKWTSLGVYNMLESPSSGIASLLIEWIAFSTVLSIRIRKTASIASVNPSSSRGGLKGTSSRGSGREDGIVPSGENPQQQVLVGLRLSPYEKAIQVAGYQTGYGLFGDDIRDSRMVKAIRYSTINCQVNDGFFVYGAILVDQFGALCMMFSKIPGMKWLVNHVTVFGHVNGSTVKDIDEAQIRKLKQESAQTKQGGFILTNLG